jgi:hypothetical protein
MTLRWVSNGPSRLKPHFHASAYCPVRKKTIVSCECMLLHLREGLPKESQVYTVDQLIGFGLVGYYKEEANAGS